MDNERILPTTGDQEAARDNKSFLDAVADQKSDARPIREFGSVNADLVNRFIHHPPKGDQAERYLAIRAKALELAQLIEQSTPRSREQSLAITHTEEAVMWANAAIARNE